MKKLAVLLVMILLVGAYPARAQDMSALIGKVRAKIEQVNDYTADGKLRTDIAFIKAPLSKVKVYFKKPDRFRIKQQGGISVLPRGGLSINMGALIMVNNPSMALAAGEAMVNGVQTKVVKLLPENENSDIVLSTLYIDEANLLVRKAVTTTRENGTYEVVLSYGRYSNLALPDKVVFSFNTKDYKLPKGLTLEFEEGEKKTPADKLKNKKGKVEIVYTSYTINKGVDDSLFR
jgi:outer membrane lipoprotein-sorting protein